MKLKLITFLLVTMLVATLSSCSSSSEKPERRPAEANLSEASDINVQLAVGYMQRGDNQAARSKLEKAIEQAPDNVVAYKTLAYLYATLGMVDEAEEKYSEALNIKPDDPDLSNNYGVFLCSIGKLDEAQERFRVAYSNPFYKSVYLAESNAGSCYIKEGKYKEAERLLRKSLRVHDKLAGSLISMAEIGVKTERYLMARAYIQRYHDVRPVSPGSLWLQIQAEKALGAKQHYLKYARQLISEFPDSDEAGWVEAQARDEQLR